MLCPPPTLRMQFESLAGFSAIVDRLGQFQESMAAHKPGGMQALQLPAPQTLPAPPPNGPQPEHAPSSSGLDGGDGALASHTGAGAHSLLSPGITLRWAGARLSRLELWAWAKKSSIGWLPHAVSGRRFGFCWTLGEAGTSALEVGAHTFEVVAWRLGTCAPFPRCQVCALGSLIMGGGRRKREGGK